MLEFINKNKMKAQTCEELRITHHYNEEATKFYEFMAGFHYKISKFGVKTGIK